MCSRASNNDLVDRMRPMDHELKTDPDVDQINQFVTGKQS